MQHRGPVGAGMLPDSRPSASNTSQRFPASRMTSTQRVPSLVDVDRFDEGLGGGPGRPQWIADHKRETVAECQVAAVALRPFLVGDWFGRDSGFGHPRPHAGPEPLRRQGDPGSAKHAPRRVPRQRAAGFSTETSATSRGQRPCSTERRTRARLSSSTPACWLDSLSSSDRCSVSPRSWPAKMTAVRIGSSLFFSIPERPESPAALGVPDA